MPIRAKKLKQDADAKRAPTTAAPQGLIPYDEPGQMTVTSRKDVSDGRVMADLILSPVARHAALASESGARGFGGKPPAMDAYESLSSRIDKAATGDMEDASRTLAAQAATLDALFTEMARRSRDNMGSYFDAAERYMRLALKAQSNCRTTLEALAKLHQPREQTVRHVHVNEGGQAVIAEQFHHHTGGTENGKAFDQSHAPDRPAERSAALPSPDPLGNGVPIPSREGKAPVPNARRDQSGRS